MNASQYAFTVESTRSNRYGLGAIKGVGSRAADAIAEERANNGPYQDLGDLVEAAGVDLIQMRNLSIDPALYCRAMKLEGEGLGMVEMLTRLKQRIPRLQYGYFNRTRENFYPEGYETDWPLPV